MLWTYKLLFLTSILAAALLTPFLLAHQAREMGWLLLVLGSLAGILFSLHFSWVEFIKPPASQWILVVYTLVYGITAVSAVLLALFVLLVRSNFFQSERHDFEFSLLLPGLILIIVPPFVGWMSFAQNWERSNKRHSHKWDILGETLLIFAFVLLASSTARHIIIGD